MYPTPLAHPAIEASRLHGRQQALPPGRLGHDELARGRQELPARSGGPAEPRAALQVLGQPFAWSARHVAYVQRTPLSVGAFVQPRHVQGQRISGGSADQPLDGADLEPGPTAAAGNTCGRVWCGGGDGEVRQAAGAVRTVRRQKFWSGGHGPPVTARHLAARCCTRRSEQPVPQICKLEAGVDCAGRRRTLRGCRRTSTRGWRRCRGSSRNDTPPLRCLLWPRHGVCQCPDLLTSLSSTTAVIPWL